MSKNIVRYEHFAMRLHDESRRVEQPKSWAFRTQYGALYSFVVGAVDNPAPVPKVQTESIPGASGALDMTESAGRVFFENKTVTITLSGEASFNAMDEIERLFAPWQGRKIDFTFDDVLDVKWYMVGRMTAAFDRTTNRVVLTIDAEPYRRGTESVIKILSICPNIDKQMNQWDTGAVSNGNALYMESQGNKICYGVDNPGTVIDLYHGAESNQIYMLGVRSIVGGTIELFSDSDDGTHYHKFLAKSTIGTTQQGGSVGARIVVDGSYYEWHNDLNGNLTYMPTVRIDYVFTKPNQIVYGDDVKIDEEHLINVHTNVQIRPIIEQFYNPCTLVVDGVAVDSPLVNAEHNLPMVTIPGIRADYSANELESVFAILPPDYAIDSAGGDPSTFITVYPLEVW